MNLISAARHAIPQCFEPVVAEPVSEPMRITGEGQMFYLGSAYSMTPMIGTDLMDRSNPLVITLPESEYADER